MRRRELIAGLGTLTLASAQTAAPSKHQAPHAFLAVAVEWPTPLDEAVPFRIRASRDGRLWSPWRDARRDPHVPESSRAFLAFEDSGYRFVELDGAPAGVKLHFIDPGPSANAFTQSVAPPRASLSKPPVVGRLEWGSPDGNNMRGTPSYSTVTHLIIHHTADGPVADFAAWIRAIWSFHVNVNGWADIGYNYLIAPNGVIFEGRAGGDNVIGAHFSCQNSGTMGVALLGNYMDSPPTAAALASLVQLLAWRAAALDLNPGGTTLHRGTNLPLPVISSHRDGNPSPLACTRTDCPGNQLYPLLGRIRTEVAALIARTPRFSAAPGSLWRSGARRQADWWYGDPATGTYDIPGQVSQGSLESTTFELTADSTLTFESWHQTEAGNYDRKLVEISANGGDWQLLDTITGPSEVWDRRSVRLTARGNIRLRFRFDSVDPIGNLYEGWYLHAIQVSPSI